MTVTELESYLEKGLGRAILLLKQEPDKAPFREAVLTHLIGGRNRYYYSERSLAYVLDLLACFDGVGLDYLMLWPYDQGGCTCARCYPWGSKGFWEIAKKQAALARAHFPDVEIIFSCWRFDHFTEGEWDAVIPRLQREGEWIDRIMIDINTQLPEGLRDVGKPIVSFPEISMYRATPWGGFGANPFPMALQR